VPLFSPAFQQVNGIIRARNSRKQAPPGNSGG
jgi:hypothetical protein